MARYKLSGKADGDLVAIARASILQWGVKRAEAYVLGLHETFQQLSEFPDIGQDASAIRTGYMKMECNSHIVFYRKIADGILIVRVLHGHMDFRRHF